MTHDTARAALEPCPFCGGTAESDSLRSYRNMTTGNLEYAAAIYCTSCNADMTWCYRDTPEIDRDQVMSALTEEWNTRASTSQGDVPGWECMGRKQSLPEPGECSWPDCGCDPHATKVIESLVEQGWQASAGVAPGPPDPTAAERREIVARIIDPEAWTLKPWNENWHIVAERKKAAAFAKADAILAALEKEEWHSPETAPRDGTPIHCQHVATFRWLPYKPASEQARRGIKGRWQLLNEYGGWDNTTLVPTAWCAALDGGR